MIKVGLLGVGHLGKIHLKLLKEISQFQIVGFFDSDIDKAKQVEKENNGSTSLTTSIPLFNSADELISQCDAVDIVTPTVSHHALAIKALKNSKHIFIEKPLANTLEEAKEIMNLSAEANVKVQVGHVERFNPAFLSVKDYY